MNPWLKRLLVLVGVLIVLFIIAQAVLSAHGERWFRLRSSERKQWKQKALQELRERAGDSPALSNDVNRVRVEMASDPQSGWIGTNLLVMTNGEWLLYRNKCVKEPGHIHDLFLAQGSNGKWYYSTFHFCTQMITLHGQMFGENDHGSIAEFERTYALREFDGKSDECLEKTWPAKATASR